MGGDSTESVVGAVCAVAREYGHGERLRVTHDIGADQVSRRTQAPFGSATDPGGSLPHEGFVEIASTPAVEVTVYPDGDAAIDVDGVEFRDVPREQAPAFLRAVYDGSAYVHRKVFPPQLWLVVPLPDGTAHRELVLPLVTTPWLRGRARPTPGTSG